MSAAAPDTTSTGDEATPSPAQGPTPAPSPASSPIAPAPDWRSSLSEDLRANPSIAKWDGNEEGFRKFASDYAHLQKFVGSEKIPLPKADAPADEWDRVWNALGRPETPEGYEVDPKVPEGMPWDTELQGEFLKLGHQAGLTQKQAQALLEGYAGLVKGQWEGLQTDVAQRSEQAVESLHKEWGRAYPAKVDLAQRALRTVLKDKVEEFAGIALNDGTLLGNHPLVVKVFAELGGRMSEAGLVGDKETRSTMTPAEAQREYKRLEGDPAFMKSLMDKHHPEHEYALERRRQLSEMMETEGR